MEVKSEEIMENDVIEEEYYDDESVDDDYYFVLDDKVKGWKKKFTILNQEDIRRRLDDEILYTSYLLNVPRDAATVLLCRYNWNVNILHQDWLAHQHQEIIRKISGLWISDQETVCKVSGLVLEEKNPILDSRISSDEFFCEICLQNCPATSAVAAGCGHHFCNACWQTCISKSINECGRGCLMLRCPQPSCEAMAGRALVYSLVSEEDKKKYDNCLVRSYVEDNANTKWCPAPGCDFAVECEVGRKSTGECGKSCNFDVSCNCSYKFCWNCLEEAHSPLDCATLVNWKSKTVSESENWIFLHTKPCPQCKRPIEKINDTTCIHITCPPPCNFSFCWLCVGPQSLPDHRSFAFACIYHQKAKAAGKYDEAERMRKMVSSCLQKYTLYHDRWVAEDSSTRRDLIYLHQLETECLDKLSQVYGGETMTTLNFIIDAGAQIEECKRVLKWLHAYMYYVQDSDLTKKNFCEYSQEQANTALGRLYQYLVKELLKFLKSEERPLEEGFHEIPAQLIGLTSATRIYFDNLVNALEFNGPSNDIGARDV